MEEPQLDNYSCEFEEQIEFLSVRFLYVCTKM